MCNTLKEKIRLSFNRSWKTYDNYCSVQKKVCEDCVALISHYGKEFDVIADFACGTGISTQFLTNHLIYKKCYAVDMAQNLLIVAKNKLINNNIEFILSDFDKQLFDGNYLDFIFCNMGLQWSLNLVDTLKLFNSYLTRSGLIVFSMPVDQSLPEIKQNYKNKMYKSEEIKELLKQNNFEVCEFFIKTYVENFCTPYDALKSIKAIGANCIIPLKQNKPSGLSRINITDIFLKHPHPTLTYQIAVFVAKKRVSL